eukprot:Rmarinus@m.23648
MWRTWRRCVPLLQCRRSGSVLPYNSRLRRGCTSPNLGDHAMVITPTGGEFYVGRGMIHDRWCLLSGGLRPRDTWPFSDTSTVHPPVSLDKDKTGRRTPCRRASGRTQTMVEG